MPDHVWGDWTSYGAERGGRGSGRPYFIIFNPARTRLLSTSPWWGRGSESPLILLMVPLMVETPNLHRLLCMITYDDTNVIGLISSSVVEL